MKRSQARSLATARAPDRMPAENSAALDRLESLTRSTEPPPVIRIHVFVFAAAAGIRRMGGRLQVSVHARAGERRCDRRTAPAPTRTRTAFRRFLQELQESLVSIRLVGGREVSYPGTYEVFSLLTFASLTST